MFLPEFTFDIMLYPEHSNTMIPHINLQWLIKKSIAVEPFAFTYQVAYSVTLKP